MMVLDVSEATASLGKFAKEMQHDPVVVTIDGQPVAALVPISGMDLETLAVGTSPKFLDIIERSRRRHEAEGGISSEEMRRRLGLPPFEEPKPKARKRKPSAKNHHRNRTEDGRQV